MPAPYKLGSEADHARDVRDLAILAALEAGETQMALAVRFGAPQSHISQLYRETYRHDRRLRTRALQGDRQGGGD